MPAGPASPPGFAETTAAAAGRLRWWLADRLDRLALTSTSLLGVCLALGITASGWFTGGTRSADLNGAIALCCGYLAALGARRLAGAQPGSQAARTAAWPARRAIGASGQPPGEQPTDDWRAGRSGVGSAAVQALPAGDRAWPARRARAGSAAVRRLAGGDRAGWLAALATRLFDSVVYVGLAVGALALGWGDQIWPLAIAVLALVSVRETMLACAGGGLRADAGQDGIARRVIMTVATMPLGGRVLLIAVVAPIWGPRAALLALLDWGIIAVGLGLGSHSPARRKEKAEPAENEDPDLARRREQPSALSALLHADPPPPAPPHAAAPPAPTSPPAAPHAAASPAPSSPSAAPDAAAPRAPTSPPPNSAPTTPPMATPPMTTPPTVSSPPHVPPVSTPPSPASPFTTRPEATPSATPGDVSTPPVTVVPPVYTGAADSVSTSAAAGAAWPGTDARTAGSVATPAEGRRPISVLRMEINAPPAGLRDAGHDLADNARDTEPPWPFALADDSDDPEDAADTDGFAAIRPDAINAAAYASGPPAPSAHASADDFDEAEDTEDTEDPVASHITTPEDRRVAAARAVVMRSRDDGMIARWFGGVASGHLMPLPPALLALAAVATIAHMGLRDLPGLLILAPALIMLVAAPGASHRHDGRLDWLVPAVLLGAQVIYIAALGFASGVPAPVTFGLCATLAIYYADLGAPGSPPLPGRNGRERGSWLGWDGRMLACGLGAAMGIAMFAYLALAVYLAVLVCWKITTGYSGFREGDCR